VQKQQGVNEACVQTAALCRTVVAKAISDSSSKLDLALVTAIQAADQQLRSLSWRIADALPAQSFQRWRELIQPNENAWWWWLDHLAAQEQSPLWTIGTGFVVTLSLAFFTVVVSRFFESGPDLAGAAAVVFQSVLTLLAGSALLDFGQERINKLLDRFSIRRSRRQRWNFGFALLVLALAVGLRVSLPLFSRWYNCAGLRRQAEGDLSGAIASFRRAIALNPDFTAAHYNLATAYEDVGGYDDALGAYQSAIRGNAGMLEAYNNLGRLLMIHKQNYATALRLLTKAESLKPSDQHSRFSIAKNKGWANFGLQNYDEALFDLRAAVTFDGRRSSAHCLLAQTYEAKKDSAASAEWCKCTTSQINDAEPEWLEKASERSAQLSCNAEPTK
jgi:tetratricopeptide (TPR) repeat protein